MPRSLPSAAGFQPRERGSRHSTSEVAPGTGEEEKEEGEEGVFLAGEGSEGWRISGTDGLPGGAG